MTLPERIVSRLRVDANGCWIWQGARTRDYYGYIKNLLGRRALIVGVHRAMHEEAHGPIPDGLVIKHDGGAHPAACATWVKRSAASSRPAGARAQRR